MEAYKGVLALFMTYFHNREEPGDIVSWFNFHAFGHEEPGPNDCPTEICSNTLKYWKKSISSFVPNKHMQWNDISNIRNPTKSTTVNELIKRVKKAEV